MREIIDRMRNLLLPADVVDLKSMLEEIREYTAINFAGFQDIKMLTQEWPLGVSKSIQGNDTMLVEKCNSRISLVTRIPAAHMFPIHWHDMEETVLVIKGQMTDSLVDVGTISEGEKLVYKPHIKHRPANASLDEDCIVFVTFKI